MIKEKQIQEYDSKQLLIEELSKMPLMMITTAWLYAINHTLYDEDVTERWTTATQNARALEKAYRKGYYDAMINSTPLPKRIEHGTDGNLYEMSITNGKEYEENKGIGHWIIDKEYNGYETVIADCKCSVCGEKALLKESYSMDGQSIILYPSNYCPNCGKDMRETNDM